MTWGISGPVFLGFYAAVFAVLLLGAKRDRRRLGLGAGGGQVPVDRSAADARRFDPDETALLTGGRPLVGAAALIALQEHGSVSSERSTVRATDTAPDGASRVQTALWRRLRESGPVRPDRARLLAAEDPTVDDVEADLVRRGFVPDPAGAQVARRWTFVLGLLGALGLVRLVAGIAAERPVGYLVLLLLLTLIAGGWTFSIPRITAAGREHLRQLRERGAAYRSGGLPGERAIAVALFGAAVLWTADATLAEELGMQRASAWGTGAEAAGGGCGSDGGDGGGGGSSCGGGCGGGGCGG